MPSSPQPDSSLAGVHFANRALLHIHRPAARDSPRFRARLITLATLANTALTATVLARELGRSCVFGVCKLSTRQVGVRHAGGWTPGFAEPPAGDTELIALVTDAAASLQL